MSFASSIAYFVAGLVLLVWGAEWLVRGASRLAASFGVSALVIGLTIVAYGTSSPELAVSVRGALAGRADLAVGNVVGSNIFNVLFILGCSAVVAPLAVAAQLLRFDIWVMVGVSAGTLALSLDGEISRFEGLGLFAASLVYTLWLIRLSRREGAAVQTEFSTKYGAAMAARRWRVLKEVALVAGGLVLLVWGAQWLVDSATWMAQRFGISELVIGLTVVAAGTSLPELATSVVASVRGERDIAVGNIVGSNIFNLLTVLGLSAAVSPRGMSVSPGALSFDMPVMLAVALACLPIFFTGGRIDRWEGLLFLGYYGAYVIYLGLDAARHEALPAFRTALLWFALPLTAVTLAVSLASAFRRRRPPRRASSA